MRKGQAAMEFLTTYGWAILVVISVITALAYLGILNPENLAGDRCVGLGDFTCKDWTARSDSGITLEIVPARDMYILQADIDLLGSSSNIALTDCGTHETAIPSGGLLYSPVDFENAHKSTKRAGGEGISLRIDCLGASSWPDNARIDADIAVTFMFTNSGIRKTEVLEVRRLRVS